MIRIGRFKIFLPIENTSSSTENNSNIKMTKQVFDTTTGNMKNPPVKPPRRKSRESMQNSMQKSIDCNQIAINSAESKFVYKR